MIKKFEDFSINEGVGETISSAVAKALSFFKKKFGDMFWWNYGLFAQKKGWLKSSDGKPKVEIYDFSKSSGNIKDSDYKPDEYYRQKLESKVYEGERVKLEATVESKIRNVDVSELVPLLKRKYRMKIANPGETYSTFIWGAPGIGKTDVVKQLARDLKVKLIIWHLGTIEPSDFIGIPEIKKLFVGGKPESRSAFALPEIFPHQSDSDSGGIMFLDELNLANELVLKAGMRLCLDGEVTNYKLPDKWIIIAAGNRKEEADVTLLSKPLGNRFAHFNLVTTVEDWTKWAIGRKEIDTYVVGFLNFNRDAFHYLDESDAIAWPSPRSWSKASAEYVQAKEWGERLGKEDIKLIFAQYVGNDWASDFVGYLEVMQKFSEEDIKKVYDNPDAARVLEIEGADNLRLDQAQNIMKCIAFYYKDKKLTRVQLENVFKYTVKISNMEMATTLLAYVNRVHPELLEDPDSGWRELYLKYWYPKYKSDISLGINSEGETKAKGKK